MKINTNPVRGTYDYAPKEAEVRERVRETILNCYEKNGFSLINTPILENLSLLSSSDGGDNLKLMFKTVKRGEKLDLNKPNLTESDITEEGLRYDLTVPLARFYANNMDKLPSPFKAIQIDYSFRAERPQKGRDRQFIQCDIDILGDDSVRAEIECLYTGLLGYSELGFKNLVAKVNSRQILNGLLSHFNFDEKDFSTICVSLDKLDKIGYDGVRSELDEKFTDSNRNAQLMSAINDIKVRGLDALLNYGVEENIVSRIRTLIDFINNKFKNSEFKYSAEFDITIIRGQGYYTGAVFEVYSKDFSGAIGGGGRYDNMIEKLVGIKVCAVGFSIGFSRVCLLLQNNDEKFRPNKLALIYDEEKFNEAFLLKEKLKSEYNVSLYKAPKNTKNLLEKLKYIGFNHYAFYRESGDLDIKEIN